MMAHVISIALLVSTNVFMFEGIHHATSKFGVWITTQHPIFYAFTRSTSHLYEIFCLIELILPKDKIAVLHLIASNHV